MIPLSTGPRAISTLFTVFAIVATCSLASAQDSSALTNEDVIKPVNAGLPSAAGLAKIPSSRTDLDTSVDALAALSAEGIPADVPTAMAEADKQAPAPSAASAQTGTAAIRQSASAAANVRPNFAGTATAPSDSHTPDQIRAAMAIGADDGADRPADACEAPTRRGGLSGRVSGNRAVRSVLSERADGHVSRGAVEPALRTGADLSPEVMAAFNEISRAAAKRKADGTLPPLPDRIRVRGQPPLACVAGHALQLRRLRKPLPEPDSADAAAMIGRDLFEIRAPDCMKGIEFIVTGPRGGDDEQAVALPVSLEVGDSAMVAQFAKDDVKRIAEDTEVEVVVVTASGEFRCNLDDRKIRRGFDPL